MFCPVRSGKFKKDYKLCIKRNYDGYFEAHIQPDWLIIWYIDLDDKTPDFEGSLNLVRTGTHSDLFKK